MSTFARRWLSCLISRTWRHALVLGFLPLSLVACGILPLGSVQAPPGTVPGASTQTARTPERSPTATLPQPAVTQILPTAASAVVSQFPPSPTLAPTSTATAVLIPTPTQSYTPGPYTGLAIQDLIARDYGGGMLQIEQAMDENAYFARYLVAYPSDGLQIYGFMDVPKGGGPFPVVIAVHGYIDPDIYTTLDYTTTYADLLAIAGYLVIHPNLRGYPPSDDGPNLFRVGMAVDILNLIALVKGQGGKAGALAEADPGRIGLWGHSMGGGISTRVMVVSPDVRAVLLYGAMSGDEQKNFERIWNNFSNGTRGLEELDAPPEVFSQVSPINFLDRVQAAVSIHHGEHDSLVPLEWSQDLCDRLRALGKPVECFTYPGQQHTFSGDGLELFNQRMIDFFNRQLKNGG